MTNRSIFAVARVLAVVMFSVVLSPCVLFAAPTVFFESPPTLTEKLAWHSELLARELPRQALLLTASREMGWHCVDSTLEPGVAAPADAWRVAVQRFGAEKLESIHLELRDESAAAAPRAATTKPAPLDVVDLKPKVQANESIDYTDLCAQSSALVSTKWAPMIAKLRGATINPVKWDASLPVPKECDSFLSTVDFFHAYLATRAAHQAILDSGESPQRLGMLVRGYAHLADSTRNLVSAQSQAFFARSLLFAQRYIDLSPNDPLAYWHRAYVEALLGQPLQAAADLKRGDELAGNGGAGGAIVKAPAWVDLTRELLAYHAAVLSEKSADPEHGALAAYFAVLSVEHCPMRLWPRRAARVALEKNPGALRLYQTLAAEGSMREQGRSAAESPVKLNAMLAELASEPSIDPQIAAAAIRLTEAKFSEAAMLHFLAELDAQPPQLGQPLPWSTLAAIVRETQFLMCYRVAHYIKYAAGGSPASELQRWWPLVKSHRYSPLLETFNAQGVASSKPEVIARVRAINWLSASTSCFTMIEQLSRINISTDPTLGLDWVEFWASQSDGTVYDDVKLVASIRSGSERYLSMRRGAIDSLLAISPNHPAGIVFALWERWKAIETRLDQIERELIDQPGVAASLGRRYLIVNQTDRGRALIERALHQEPGEYQAYRWLAMSYFGSGDVDAGLRIWEQARTEVEDIGLIDLSLAREVVPTLLMKNRAELALPWAERAAQTGAQGGMNLLGDTLAALGRADEAIASYRSAAQGYNRPMPFYMEAKAMGHPAVQDAVTLVEAYIPNVLRRGVPGETAEVGIYFYLQGERAKSLDTWARISDPQYDPLVANLIAMQLWETGPEPAAKAAFEKAAHAKYESTASNTAYLAASVELARVFNDPHATFSEETVRKLLPSGDEGSRAAAEILYFVGRACELRERNDEAKKWYREALGKSYKFACRPMAIIALRRLGDEYYPQPKK